MGLPMFREPEEISAEKTAAKLDQVAARNRSSIRRESTVRPDRPDRPASTRSPLYDRLSEARRNTTSNFGRPRRAADTTLEQELEQHRQRRLARGRSNRDAARRSILNDYIHREPGLMNDPDFELFTRDRDGTEELSDWQISAVLGHMGDRPFDGSSALPRPNRESSLRFEVAASSQSESEQQPRRARWYRLRDSRLSSPSTSNRSRAERSPSFSAAIPDGPLRAGNDEDDTAARLTPGFAPAHPSTDSPAARDDQPPRPTVSTVDGLMDTPPPESLQVSYPPLRRGIHQSPRPLNPALRVDGLGDRLRSPSPTDEGPEEENWSGLLATMDSGPNSQATSFMSSRSDSHTRSNRSSQATSAATSFGEIGADDTCDLDLPSGITYEDVQEIRARHRTERPLPPGRPERREEISSDSLERSLARGDDRVFELEVFGIILDRMQRRQDIPDEWWAAVGLSPDVVRGSA